MEAEPNHAESYQDGKRSWAIEVGEVAGKEEGGTAREETELKAVCFREFGDAEEQRRDK